MAIKIQSCIELEAEPCLISSTSSQGRDHIQYLDLIAGINDCISHKALMVIEKALRILFEMRSRSSYLVARSMHEEFEATLHLGDAKAVELRRHRIVNAFNFVRRECQFAAKLIDFGLRHMQSTGSIDEPLI